MILRIKSGAALWRWLFCSVAGVSTKISHNHQVPKERDTLSGGDWFPYVISKLAPLEWWSFAARPAEVRRRDYPSDGAFDLAKQNTWEFPRFCFSFFRASPEVFASLRSAVDEYNGEVVWAMYDDYIGAIPFRPAFSSPLMGKETMGELEEAIRNPPRPDPEFVKRAMADIPRFSTYLEGRLGLGDKLPLDFNPRWLTREGLATSRAAFEDFIEPGSWSVFLARDPAQYVKTAQPTSPDDRRLSMGIGMVERDLLFKELGADWKKYQRMGGVGPILSEYPLLSRLDDITSDALYQPDEVNALLAECLRAQASVKDPRSIRGLDNLIRIAHWAQRLNVGIYFSGQ